MAYRKEIIAEIVRQNSSHFGSEPSILEYLKFRFIIRNWSDEKLLTGLVTMNINIDFSKRGNPHGAAIGASVNRKMGK